jgi:flagella basal body P-ring formation protein FlgA
MIRLLAFLLALLAGAAASAAATLPEKLEAALAAQGKLAGGARVELDNPALRDAEDGTVESVTIDARTSRIVAFVADDGTKATRVTGRLRWMIEVPVLNRVLAPGETIAAHDLDIIELRSDAVSAALVTDASELVGKTARRALRPNQPLRAADIRTPVVVKKGDLVTIVLEAPALRLTVQGRAVEDGGQGATIRVANTNSGRTIEAVVTGPGTVAVGARRAVN